VSEFIIRRNFVKTLEEIYYCVLTLPENARNFAKLSKSPGIKSGACGSWAPRGAPQRSSVLIIINQHTNRKKFPLESGDGEPFTTSDWVYAKILRDRVSISLVHVGLIDESTLDQRNLVSRNTIELKETLLI